MILKLNFSCSCTEEVSSSNLPVVTVACDYSKSSGMAKRNLIFSSMFWFLKQLGFFRLLFSSFCFVSFQFNAFSQNPAKHRWTKNTERVSPVIYFRKKFYLNCLTRFWIRLWVLCLSVSCKNDQSKVVST